MKLTHEDLRGTWIVEGSEIDHLEPGGEIYHFQPPDTFIYEFPPSTRRIRYRYQLTEDGFTYGRKGAPKSPVTAWLEAGYLILRPPHLRETWSRRA
ncbi:hypothetical protein OVA24_09735 [Luteolibacter sp. SL250]|uniref:hypothetical protein n=1 Tax=Luteolibacter sp. SL250 TaxID=2995170 RepID=UPI0022708A8C|nr:hypothetical protein [Luteolibacter sp. SL250]WAC21665.1 hypothetical protein OVA24_09735 [Luteolibacter sp. SL250]